MLWSRTNFQQWLARSQANPTMSSSVSRSTPTTLRPVRMPAQRITPVPIESSRTHPTKNHVFLTRPHFYEPFNGQNIRIMRQTSVSEFSERRKTPPWGLYSRCLVCGTGTSVTTFDLVGNRSSGVNKARACQEVKQGHSHGYRPWLKKPVRLVAFSPL